MDARDLQQVSMLLENIHLQQSQVHHEMNGDLVYKLWNKCHRTDGPAIVRMDGTKEFCIYGTRYQDVAAWAKAALAWEFKCINQESINEKIAQMMQQDLFN